MWQEIWKLTIGSALPWHNSLMPWCSQWHTGSRRKCLAWTEWLRFGQFILICIDSDSNETSRTQDIKEIEDTSLDIAGGKLCMSFASFHSSMLSLPNFFLTRPVAGHKETEDRESERETCCYIYIMPFVHDVWRVHTSYLIILVCTPDILAQYIRVQYAFTFQCQLLRNIVANQQPERKKGRRRERVRGKLSHLQYRFSSMKTQHELPLHGPHTSSGWTVAEKKKLFTIITQIMCVPNRSKSRRRSHEV